ncbi:hypothetical protein FIBSPDRAFT_890608 [Athelia psychrophila]|uniref:Uncharacterized protein n=1 Tax=Athelia psychrophila TaxID=1759441 RepID=A0A166KUS0_9AGAM|nr:hypothetical protein FIBSPDRAFT_890608 [Fibularhizoctonia sp. CBS 109695]
MKFSPPSGLACLLRHGTWSWAESRQLALGGVTLIWMEVINLIRNSSNLLQMCFSSSSPCEPALNTQTPFVTSVSRSTSRGGISVQSQSQFQSQSAVVGHMFGFQIVGDVLCLPLTQKLLPIRPVPFACGAYLFWVSRALSLVLHRILKTQLFNIQSLALTPSPVFPQAKPSLIIQGLSYNANIMPLSRICSNGVILALQANGGFPMAVPYSDPNIAVLRETHNNRQKKAAGG